MECDLDLTQRAQLSEFFHKELQTSDWIRATSPACNCNHSFVPGAEPETAAESSPLGPWPGMVTCHADREDHGTTGAYTAWPALATEALCYIEGNCSSAFKMMASFAPNTVQGAFGQANAVPQDHTFPYTPHNDEPAFKPADRRYLNMAVGAFADAVVRGFFGYVSLQAICRCACERCMYVDRLLVVTAPTAALAGGVLAGGAGRDAAAGKGSEGVHWEACEFAHAVRAGHDHVGAGWPVHRAAEGVRCDH